ncbi:MAG TPA: hypothetical protein VH640_24075 [Bryobacteraceae bacterium]|jgi:hypothetical protein
MKESSANSGTMEGYRKAFDALEARVKAIEEKLGGQGPRGLSNHRFGFCAPTPISGGNGA